MAVEQAEILKEAVETLRADAALIVLLGGAFVFNHVPQDHDQPYVVVLWQADERWDTKDSTGFQGSLNHEVVSTHHGDKIVLQVVDAIVAAYKAAPLVLVNGRIVCFDYQSGAVVIQVFETHRAIASFNVLVDADGVGGLPIPDPDGAAIIVQDEGVDLANTPHKKLNFLGDGVTAVNAGGGVADITIPGEGGGGGGPDEFIVKSADESIVNSAVVQDDDELRFSVEPGEKWYATILVYFTGQDGPPPPPPTLDTGLVFTVDVGSGAPAFARFNRSSLTFPFGAGELGGVGSSLQLVFLTLSLDNTGGESTELIFRWSPNRIDARPVTVKKGSQLLAWKQ